MKFPITAVTSILHRLSGLLLFVLIPFVLWMAWFSLSSPHNFQVLKWFMTGFWMRFIVWVLISGLFYHIVAGIRHLLMDIGLGETLEGGRFGAWFILVFTVVVIVLLGIFMLCSHPLVW
jgi:succinate dehydrogenase / fumarate reductase cytochrome b subunit